MMKDAGYGVTMGLNYKLNALGAALGSSQLSKLDLRLSIRKTNAELWKKHLAKSKLLENYYHDNDEDIPSYYGVIFLINKRILDKKINFAKHLNTLGICTDIFRYKYRLLCEYPLFSEYFDGSKSSSEMEFSNASSLVPRLLVLPTHEHLNNKIIKQGANIINEALQVALM